MTKFGTYQEFRRNDGRLVRNIAYSGIYNPNFFVNTSGFPSELEREKMRLFHNSTLWMIIENYRNKDRSSLDLGKIGIENLYPGLLSGRDWGSGNTRIVVGGRLTSLVADPGTVPIENLGARDGIWDYTAWHTTPVGDYQNRGGRAARENHYPTSVVTTSGFTQELPYTKGGSFNLPGASGGLERRFVGMYK